MKNIATVVAVCLMLWGDAWATSSSGVVVTNKVSSSPANIESLIVQEGNSGQLQLHQEIGSDKAPVNVNTGTQTIAPGGFSGWHSHPGPGWVIVVSGTATEEKVEGCFVDYPAGSVLFEAGPTDIHNLSNRSITANLVIRTWFFSPVGVPTRIDQQPVQGQCDAGDTNNGHGVGSFGDKDLMPENAGNEKFLTCADIGNDDQR
jgi:quercetin dioxygenase-like cupin family protein